MTYPEALDWLYQQLPMFQNKGAKALKKDLTNINALCDSLNKPQNAYKTIHIAGTNGKGTVSHLIAAILQASGYKCGLYTSPHYKDFRERIKVNGTYIREEQVLEFLDKTRDQVEDIVPSFFELTVAMAFDHFRNEQVDIAVIETGLGGILDSTNIIHPELSIITNISYDHQNILGDSIEEIASSKAGIIKENTPVIIGEPNSLAEPIFIQTAEQKHAPLSYAYKDLKAFYLDEKERHTRYNFYHTLEKTTWEDIEVEVCGPFIRRNIITAVSAAQKLKSLQWNITKETIYEGLKHATSLSNYIGRWQILSTEPLIIADSGHNEAAIELSMNYLKALEYTSLHIVLGFVKDKSIEKLLNLLPIEAHYYFTQATIPRALDVEILAENAMKFGLKGQNYNSVSEAILASKAAATENDLIFIGGSSFIVAESI